MERESGAVEPPKNPIFSFTYLLIRRNLPYLHRYSSLALFSNQRSASARARAITSWRHLPTPTMIAHRLKDVVVVLTGASSGIGASIAEHLLSEGANVS